MEKSPIVVVTGASAGIGRATALAFGRRGWRVALIARGVDGLEAAAGEIRGAGAQAMVIQADVASHRDIEAAAERIEREWGPIDVWINNAMATIFSPFLQISPEDFRRATDVTYLGSVWGTLAALKRMSARDRGTIVQVGSALAYRSIPLQAPYCGAKSALRGFIDSLRSELIQRRSRVHLTMVQLSAFNTPQFDWGRNRMGKRAKPLGKIFEPELAAEAIYWASQRKRREVWVGFPAAQAILGTKIIPGILDWWLALRAYAGQHTDEPLPRDYKDNLYEPVAGDRGARGRFSGVAKTFSVQFWLNTHLPSVIIASLALILAAAVWLNKLYS